MKAYVIKNKEGKYGFAFAGDIYPDTEDADKLLYTNDITKALLYSEEDKEYCQMIGMNENYVPITICEGDLEEENRVLKRALELACEELETRDEGKTHARLFIQKIKNNYLGDTVGYEEYYIQQAKESKDE